MPVSAPAAAVLAVLAALLGALAGTGGRAPRDGAQRTGVIEGRVALPGRAVQRTVQRYAGTVPPTARTMQAVPVLAFLDGDFPTARGQTRPVRVAQQDTLFVPAALVVATGTTVDFLNGDPFFHNVFSYSRPKRFDLGRFPRGESKPVHFDAAGVVKIYCEVHQSMRALVAVVDHPYHAIGDADGRFVIAGVPPGRHQLVVVDADRGERTVRVDVAAGRTTRVDVSF